MRGWRRLHGWRFRGAEVPGLCANHLAKWGLAWVAQSGSTSGPRLACHAAGSMIGCFDWKWLRWPAPVPHNRIEQAGGHLTCCELSACGSLALPVVQLLPTLLIAIHCLAAVRKAEQERLHRIDIAYNKKKEMDEFEARRQKMEEEAAERTAKKSTAKEEQSDDSSDNDDKPPAQADLD
ncbi:hypothetical protein HaLaN_11201 [Haematococcus lacustris]|uniref:Uncharacterized protein n=1 Tax=Haematococcus lacustris TaxID=44745 RepID=A0A699ZHD3_HAELA|nr:hypothetical protein HaLaN_11201 [Haematococcus lacustris]